MNFLNNLNVEFKRILTGISARILFIILIVSVTANVFQFYAKGITIDRSDRSDRSDKRVSHQEQMQGQLFIQNTYVQGDKITWVVTNYTSLEDVASYLTTLHPSASLFAKVIANTTTPTALGFSGKPIHLYTVFVPDFIKTPTGK